MNTDPFPRRIVTGQGFCNREAERKKLSKLVLRGTAVWLQAHRRHGKSSLLEQVGEDLKAEGHHVALERCHILFNSGSESLIKQLLKSSSRLMGEVASIQAAKNGHTTADTVLHYIKDKFSKLDLNVRLERGLPSISFDRNGTNFTLDALREAMAQLDEYAAECEVRVVFIIDEFQELSKSDRGIEIEAAIRHQLEKAKATTFVFCGSERALMEQSMTDTKRPLYNHTKMFPLNRIAPEHYKKHFNRLAQAEWGSTLLDEVIDKILEYSECHPYYTNTICSDLWLRDDVPTVEDVEAVWKEVVDLAEREEKNLILSLSTNDKKVLSAIARGVNEKITSKQACKEIDLAPSSIRRAVDSLVRKDLIEISSEGIHRVVNPVIAEIARRYS